MQPILAKYEKKLADINPQIGPVLQAEILGMSYRMFASLRAGRPIQSHTRRHIEVLLLLPADTLEKYLRHLVPRVFPTQDEL